METDNIIVIDTETTGLDAKINQVVELALVPMDQTKGDLHLYVYAPSFDSHPWDPFAAAIYSDNDHLRPTISNQVSTREACVEIVSYIRHNFKKGKPILAGQNVAFDIKFLEAMFSPHILSFIEYHSIDTFSLLRAGELLGFVPSSVKSLSSALQWAEVTNPNPHTAIGDARSTRDLLAHLIYKFNRFESNWVSNDKGVRI